MNANDSAKYTSEISGLLNRFEERIKQIHHCGLSLWTGTIRRVLGDLKASHKAKDAAIYGELMQIESIAKECDSEQAKAIVSKIQKLKGLVAVMVLSLTVFSLNLQGVQTAGRTARRDTIRGGGSIHRIIRKGEDAVA